RRVDRREDVLAREAGAVLARHRPPVHLRRDDVLLTRAEELPEQPPGDDLALAAVVDVRGVEEDDSALDSATDDRLRSLLVQCPRPILVGAVAHHPKADPRDAQARAAEVHVLHGPTLPRVRRRRLLW